MISNQIPNSTLQGICGKTNQKTVWERFFKTMSYLLTGSLLKRMRPSCTRILEHLNYLKMSRMPWQKGKEEFVWDFRSITWVEYVFFFLDLICFYNDIAHFKEMSHAAYQWLWKWLLLTWTRLLKKLHLQRHSTRWKYSDCQLELSLPTKLFCKRIVKLLFLW